MTSLTHLHHRGNATIHNELLDVIDTVLVNRLKTSIRVSPCVSIGVDESTDRSKEKHAVTVIRYVSQLDGLQTTVLRLLL